MSLYNLLDMGIVLLSHIPLTDIFQRLHYQARISSLDGKIPWHRTPEGDRPAPQLNFSCRTTSQKNGIHRHLIRQPQQILRSSASRDYQSIVSPGYCSSNLLYGWVHQSKAGLLRLQINAPRQPVYHTLLCQIR